MFLKILKKDLKRKKSMNIILFIFMIMASMLIASSINMLYTTINAMDSYMEEANTADNIILANADEENDKKMEEWLSSNDLIVESQLEKLTLITAKNIKIPSQYKEYEDDRTLVMSKVSQKYNQIFNEKNKKFHLNEGEIALPITIVESYGLKIGDEITIKIEDINKKLKLVHFVKDAAFGSGFMGMKRIFLSDSDMEDFDKLVESIKHVNMWSIIKDDDASIEQVDKDFSKTSIISVFTFNKDLIAFSYVMDLILAAMMIIVSIFLIFISFLILRFTIVFTIEEDFKEIGIMKAIGLKNKRIKSIYMVKYFAITLIGGIIGFILSIPFANYLLKSVSNHIVMKTTYFNYVLSVISIVFIIFITVTFCNLCTRKMNKLSAIDAIRQGSIGERFSNSRILKLHKLNHTKTPYFLAVSDILSGFRRFVILMITFIAGTALIIIPSNIINTLNSTSILNLFGFSKFDFYVDSSDYIVNCLDGTVNELIDKMDEIKQNAKDKGVNVEVHPEINITYKVYADDKEESKSIMCIQAPNFSTDNYTYLRGTAPKIENEVAITTVLAKYYDLGIGDTIHCIIDDKDKEFVVTSLYQCMNNLGYEMRFSEKFIVNLKDSSGLVIVGNIKNEQSNKKAALNILKEAFPDLELKDNQAYLEASLGTIVGQLDLIKYLILILVLGINFLITCLLVRMLIVKEIPEIAILKSIGFKNIDIRKWQVARITIILVISIMIGTLFANLTGNFFASGVFGMMGANQITLVIKPLQVYVIYPTLILIVTIFAVITSLSQIRKTQVWEINNQE